MNRPGFLTGLSALIAAPAIVPFGSLMPVRGIVMALGGAHGIYYRVVEINGRDGFIIDTAAVLDQPGSWFRCGGGMIDGIAIRFGDRRLVS